MNTRPTWLRDGALIAGWEAKAAQYMRDDVNGDHVGRAEELRSCAAELRSRIEAAEEPEVAVENNQGARYREEHITVKTIWDDTENITQLVNAPSGIMQKRVLHALERQTREALIALGWTPPKK